MPEEKVIQVIVPEALKEPLTFDLWRLRADNDNNIILDFAKKENDTEFFLVSSIVIENHRIDSFVAEFLFKLVAINEQKNLGISLFEKANSKTKLERGGNK